jgi:hypothetical protein
MPHALVTLSDVEGDVEIEVWPKAGQSAYVVVPPPIARAIAERITLMADAADESATAASPEPVESDTPAEPDTPSDGDAPANIVDLASRRKPR